MSSILVTPMFGSRAALRTWSALGLLCGLGMYSSPAEACGGLFCSAASPVNQAAERIIFAKNPDGTVTAAIELMYEGDAEKFAWVLPVPAGEAVEPGVASKVSFDRLDAQSNPTYQLNTLFDADCPQPDFAAGASGGAGGATGPTPRDPSEDVTVVAQGNAGPYDWVQIEVDPGADDPVQTAIDWLTEGGYDVADTDPDTLRPYLSQEMNLLAFKLTKTNVEGSIRPITVKYRAEQPFIPIRPTAVAANADMGVKVWVLGEARAVPQNQYYSLELNQTLINWFNPNSNYNDVVIRAANEAGSFGFVTEQSGPAGAFSQAIYSDYEKALWDQLRTRPDWTLVDFLGSAVQWFGSYDGMDYVLADPTIVPLREGATVEHLLSCFDCYFAESVEVRNDAYPPTPYDPATDPILAMDVTKFLDAMETFVIKPLEDTRALFDASNTVTRLYTTLSPDEMIVDPSFDFNSDLPSVDNVHLANRIVQCSKDNEWRIEFDDGFVVEGNGNTWPVPDTAEMPANLRFVQMGTKGEGEEVENNSAKVLKRLQQLGVGSSTRPVESTEGDAGSDADGGGKPPAQNTEDQQTTENPDKGTDSDVSSESDAAVEPSADAEGGSGALTTNTDDSCNCRVAGAKQTSLAWGWSGLLGVAWWMRRRRSGS